MAAQRILLGMSIDFKPNDYSAVVKNRANPPKQWRWEIYRAGRSSPVDQSVVYFETMTMANRAGKDALKMFLAKNKNLTWPQMFDFAHPGLKPLGPTYGVCNIPTPLLIDRKGILRYANIALNAHVREVKHQEDPDVLIAQLLAEPP